MVIEPGRVKLRLNKSGQNDFSENEADFPEPAAQSLRKSYDELANKSRMKRPGTPKQKPPTAPAEKDFAFEDDQMLNDLMSQISEPGQPQSLNQSKASSYYGDMYAGPETGFGGGFDDDMIEPPMQNETERKKELLHRLYRMQKNGDKLPRKVTMANRLDEIEDVFEGAMHDKKMDSSVKMYKQLHFMLCNGIEKGAMFIGKGRIRLDEWADAVAANIDQYDALYDEIYYEHGDILGDMSPLLKLAILTVMSAAVYHFNAPEEENEDEIVDKLLSRIENNPDLLNRFTQRMSFVTPVAQFSTPQPQPSFAQQQYMHTSQMPESGQAMPQSRVPAYASRQSTPRTSRKSSRASSRAVSPAPEMPEVPIRNTSAVHNPIPPPPSQAQPNSDYDYLREPGPNDVLPVMGAVPDDNDADFLPYLNHTGATGSEDIGGGLVASSVMMDSPQESTEKQININAEDWEARRGRGRKKGRPKKSANTRKSNSSLRESSNSVASHKSDGGLLEF